MRSYEEIHAEIIVAAGIKDAGALRVLAAEMQAIGTPAAQAATLNALGVVATVTGDYPLALEHYNRALALHEELGNRAGVGNVTGNIGIVLRETGDYASAFESYHRALSVHEELGTQASVARAVSNLGLVYCDTGNYASALEYYRRALELYEVLADRVSVADITGNMGNLYADTGDYLSALEHYQQALTMHDELGNRAGMANITGNIGIWHARMGDFPAALEHYHRALTVHEELGNRTGVAFITGSIIRALIDLNRYDEAAALLERQTTMQIDNPVVRAAHMENHATLAEIHGDHDAARDLLIEALAITTEAGLRDQSATYHKRLRDLAQKRNDFSGFIEHNADYLRMTEEIRGKETTQRMAMMEAERRVQEEKAKNERERALLYGALPKSIADRMIRGEDVSGDHFDNAAVFFLDIVGFTSNTSHMPPADVVKMLENIFRTIDGICDTYSVIKIKTIGDSYMCFRGDADAPTNAQSIASVALDVMKGAFTWPNGSPIKFRVGIHIGSATAGVIGTQRLQYDVWGDTVNVASRMESTSEPGRIHISQALANALGEAFVEAHIVPRGIVEIKGKGAMHTNWLDSKA